MYGEFRNNIKMLLKCIVRSDVVKFLMRFKIVLAETFYRNRITDICFQSDATSETFLKRFYFLSF